MFYYICTVFLTIKICKKSPCASKMPPYFSLNFGASRGNERKTGRARVLDWHPIVVVYEERYAHVRRCLYGPSLTVVSTEKARGERTCDRELVFFLLFQISRKGGLTGFGIAPFVSPSSPSIRNSFHIRSQIC